MCSRPEGDCCTTVVGGRAALKTASQNLFSLKNALNKTLGTQHAAVRSQDKAWNDGASARDASGTTLLARLGGAEFKSVSCSTIAGSILFPFYVTSVQPPHSLIQQGDGSCLSMSIATVLAHPVCSCSVLIAAWSVLARMATRGALSSAEDTQDGADCGHAVPAVCRPGRTLQPSNTG